MFVVAQKHNAILADLRSKFGDTVTRKQLKSFCQETGTKWTSTWFIRREQSRRVGRGSYSLAALPVPVSIPATVKVTRKERRPQPVPANTLCINPDFVSSARDYRSRYTRDELAELALSFLEHEGSRSMLIGQCVEKDWARFLGHIDVEDRGKPTALAARVDRIHHYEGRDWQVQVKELSPQNLRQGGGIKCSMGMRDQADRKCLDGSVIRTTHYPFGSFQIAAVPALFITGHDHTWFLIAEWNLQDNTSARRNGVSRQIIKPQQEIVLNTNGGKWHLVTNRESFDTFMSEVIREFDDNPYKKWERDGAI